MKLTKTELKNIIKESVKDVLNETSRRQKAQQAIKGKNRRVLTMAILSAENPMGMKADKKYNNESNDELLRHLTIGHYKFFKTKGNYDGFENSIMIYNIDIDDALYLAYKYNQESLIFVDMQKDDSVSYQFWKGDDNNSKLKLQHEKHEIIDVTDADDYYTQISKHFKFRIPFFEQVEQIHQELLLKENKYNVDRMIVESLDSKRTGKSKYVIRGELYGDTKTSINETSRRQKAQQAITNNAENIRTIAIFTSDNPRFDDVIDNGETLGKEDNPARKNSLLYQLKLGYYAYFCVKGKYGSKEDSLIVYNIPLQDVEYLCKRYGQESFIFISFKENTMKATYYEQQGKGVFTPKSECDSFVNMADADDLYTQISRSFKFQFPFFDGKHDVEFEQQISKLNECHSRFDDDELHNRLTTILEAKSGYNKWANRGQVYGNNLYGKQ